MGNESQQKITKCSIALIIIASSIIFAVAATLTVLLIVWGYIGFDNSVPITITLPCANIYHTSKFSNLASSNEAAFVGAASSSGLGLFLLLGSLVWMIGYCKNQNEQNVYQPSTRSLAFSYILASLSIMASTVSTGYYLTYFLQISNCTATYDQLTILVFLALAGLSLILSLFLLFGLINMLRKNINSAATQQKYKQVLNANQSKPRQMNKYTYKDKVEETKQNIYESPNKKKYQPSYLLNDKPYQPKYSSPVDSRTPYQDIHPQNRDYVNNMPSRYQKPDEFNAQMNKPATKSPQGQLVYSRQKHSSYKQQLDEESMQKQQRRYLSRYGQSILPSSGVQEKDFQKSNNIKYNNSTVSRPEYIRQNEPSRRYQQSPPRNTNNPQREGMLLNYIRGKYAN